MKQGERIKRRNEKMQIFNGKYKGKTTAIILTLLMASITLFAIAPSPANAQLATTGAPTYTPWQTIVPTGSTPSITIATEAFMSVTPYPIGLGQPFLINLWLEPPSHTNRFFSGYSVTITKPDGTTQVLGPYNSYQGDATNWLTYIADQVGDWSFQFNFAGNYFPNGTYFNGKVYDSAAAIPPALLVGISSFGGPVYLDSAYYQPSQSPVTTVTVQQEMVASFPAAPLPTDYWTRPINIVDREWWIIGGQYPFVGQGGSDCPGWPANTNAYASNYKFTPYVQGPETAHIVWAREGALAGIASGQFGIRSVGAGEGAYAGTPNIIFQGRGYQTISKPMTVVINGSTLQETVSVWQCYDIRTGAIYWEQTGIAQVPTIVTYNQAVASEPGAGQTGMGTGSFSLMYLSGNRMIKYDPYSGAVQMNISLPFSSSTFYCDPYVLSVQSLGGGKYALVNWTTIGISMSGSATSITVLNNITYPFSSLGTTDYESMITVYTGSVTPLGAGTAQGQFVYGVSLITGNVVFNTTTSDIFFSTSTGCADHGMYAVRVLGGWWDSWYITGSKAGQLAWQTPKTGATGGESYPWGDFGPYTTASYGGLLFDFSYAGFYAIDWNTGKIAWNFVPPATPFESPWYPSVSLFSNSPIIADGKLYYGNGEHSPTEPLNRDWRLWCFNATTGAVIWSKMDGGSPGAIADGYLTFDNRYTGYLDVFGKGTSATTVSAPQTQITTGNSVIISGSVLDQSPGIVASSTSPVGATTPMKNAIGLANVACVSDDSMGTYMDYIYDQQPIDGRYHNETVTGVPVTITAVDPNGNFVTLGNANSDLSGTFAFTWQPTMAGEYTISASFAGSNSYGSSWAETHAVVTEPQATSTPTATTSTVGLATTSDLLTYIAVAVIAMIITVAIATVLILRKH
jgi:hypothetical protein